MTRPHKHGVWHQFRARLGLAIIPKCLREHIAYLHQKEQIAEAVKGVLFGGVAERDQAEAMLRDLGKQQ